MMQVNETFFTILLFFAVISTILAIASICTLIDVNKEKRTALAGQTYYKECFDMAKKSECNLKDQLESLRQSMDKEIQANDDAQSRLGDKITEIFRQRDLERQRNENILARLREINTIISDYQSQHG